MRVSVAVWLCAALTVAACGYPAGGVAVTPTPTAPPPTPVARPLGRAVATAEGTATPAVTERQATPEQQSAATPTPLTAREEDTPSAAAAAPGLDGSLDGIVPDSGATYALVLEDLASSARTQFNADQTLPSASLYKLGLAWAVLREVQAGTLSLDAPLTIDDEDTIEPEPYGGFGAGDTPTLQEAITRMLSVSSNAAAHALIRTIGRDQFAQEMDRIGLHQTRVPQDGVAVTTADDMARLLRLIATSSELSDESRTLMAQGMANIAPPDALRDTLPDEVGIYDKTGNLDDASNVVALLETQRGAAILVVIDTDANPGDARAVIARAGLIAYKALLE